MKDLREDLKGLKGIDGGVYGYVAKNYYKMSNQQLKDLLLSALGIIKNEDDVIEEYLDRTIHEEL